MSTTTQTLEIGGMHCEHCVEAVREALESVRGLSVDRVEVGTAEVTYEPDAVSPEQLATVLDDVGYELVSPSRSEPHSA
jgi:copper chaperone CopZ